jgi:riboflavin biosynthesis pyrimidine reductase
MALQRLIDRTGSALPPEDLYTRMDFPEPPEDRPYLLINMVATADGKILLGDLGDSAVGVGGPTDQMLFRRLQYLPDATLLGGATLRASQVIYPPEKPRYTVTRTGDVPLDNRFFRDAPDRAFVLAPEDLPAEVCERIRRKTNLIQIGQEEVDLTAALRFLRQERGVRTLLCEGGAKLNDCLLRLGLADELFLTLTPKLKGGAHLPTVVDGSGFPRQTYLPLHILSLYHDEDEVYFRYRIGATPETVR